MRDNYSNVEKGASISLIGKDRLYIITEVAVARQFRGRGYARELMQRVCAEADDETATLLLSVTPDGTGLKHMELTQFYESLGFRMHKEDPSAMMRLPERPRSCPNCAAEGISAHTGTYCEKCGEEIFALPTESRRKAW